METSDFQRILAPFRSNQMFTYTKAALWYSENLLLEETINAYTNSCKKYELSKIQALLYYKTQTNLIKMIIYGSITLILLIIAVAINPGFGWMIYWAIKISIFLFLTIRKIIIGDSCKAFVVTAVGEHELISVGTIKRAQIMMERMKDIIGNVQGAVDDEDLQARIEEISTITTRKPLVAKKNKVIKNKTVK